MWFRIKTSRTSDQPPLWQACSLAEKIWPWDGHHLWLLSQSDHNKAREWLNDRTGLSIANTAPFGYGHWLTRLREMAAKNT
jgi:hypothetical protein